MNEFFVVFLLGSTAILSVSLGVFSAYFAIRGLLAIVNPSANPAKRFRAVRNLVPNQSQASGD